MSMCVYNLLLIHLCQYTVKNNMKIPKIMFIFAQKSKKIIKKYEKSKLMNHVINIELWVGSGVLIYCVRACWWVGLFRGWDDCFGFGRARTHFRHGRVVFGIGHGGFGDTFLGFGRDSLGLRVIGLGFGARWVVLGLGVVVWYLGGLGGPVLGLG